jgi:hypothetical protein
MTEMRRGPVPRVTTWKVPLALFLVGLLVVKPVFGWLGSDSAGDWVAGILGFLSFVTFVLYLKDRPPAAGAGDRSGPPTS